MFYSATKNTFYPPEFRADYELNGSWPTDAVEVPRELYDQVVTNRPLNKIMVPAPDGRPTLADPPAPTLEELLARKRSSISASCEAEIAAIKAGYPDSEVLSWGKQETEARAWLADNTASTPLLDALSAGRGISKAELVARVIAKADLFAQFSGALIGKRQALEDQIDALPADATEADLEAIQW